MARGAPFLPLTFVALAALLGAVLLAAPAAAHGQGAQAVHHAAPGMADSAPGMAEHAMPHCHGGGICAPAIEGPAARAPGLPAGRGSRLRGPLAAATPPLHSPVADPPPPRV